MVTHTDSERGFDGSAWLTMGVVLLLLAGAMLTSVLLLRQPGDGWQLVYQEPPLVNFVGAWPTPLRAGDIVLSVEGRPVGSEFDITLPGGGWRAGDVLQYRVLRDGRELTLDVLLHVLPAAGVLRALAFVQRDAWFDYGWLALALVLFVLRPRSRAAQLLLIAFASLVAVTRISWAAVTIGASFAPRLLQLPQLLLLSFWLWLFFPTFVLLLLFFPLRQWPLTRYPRLVPVLLYGVPLVLLLLTAVTRLSSLALVGLAVEGVLLLAVTVAAVRHALLRGDAVARAQVAWVAFGICVSIGGNLALYLAAQAMAWPPLPVALVNVLTGLFTLLLPLSLMVAVLRYRLFDVTLIIRRTLQYTLLSLLLTLSYFGSIVLLQTLVGQALADSPLLVVASTLLIAALFAPLRRRVQRVIDRRFYRSRYDPQVVLAQFAQTCRDETDLVALQAALTAALMETMQPTRVGVWLRKE